MSRYASGTERRTCGQASMQRRVALLRLEPGDDADDLRAGLHAVLLGQRAARLLVVVARQVDAVVDEPDRRAGAALVVDLALDHPRHGDELVHVRGQVAQRLAILLRADPAGVHGRDDVRLAMADLAEGDDRPGGDGLGPEHVGVDDVGADLGQVRGQGADGDGVVRLVDDAGPRSRPAAACARRCPPTATRSTRRSATGPSGVTRPNRCSWAPPLVPVARTWTTRMRRPPARVGRSTVSRQGSNGAGALIYGSLRRTSRRWMGSSTAPHSYL